MATKYPNSYAERASVIDIFHDLVRTAHLVWSVHPVYTLSLSGLAILQGFSPALQLWVWKLIFDAAADALHSTDPIGDTFYHLCVLVGIQAIIYVLDAPLRALQNTMRQLLGELLQQHVRLKILAKASSLEMAYFENAQYYDKLRNAHQGAGYRPLEIVSQLLSLAQSTITLSSMIFLLARLHWSIFLLIAITLIPVLIVQNRYGYANYWMLRQRAPELRKQQYVNSLLTADWAIKEIRCFQLEKYLLRIFKSHFNKFFKETRSLVIKKNIAELGAFLVSMVGWLSSIIYIIFQLFQRSITIGDLTLYTRAISQTQGQLRSIISGLSKIYSNLLFVRNLYEFLAQPTRDLSAGRIWTESIQDIEFQNVSFCYPDTDSFVLKNINFKVRRGQILSLVGKNGAGKSTLIKLLCRLYEPTSGVIMLNGKDIAQYSPRSVQEQISVIFQDYGRYHFTAQENIGFGEVSLIDDISAIKSASYRSKADSVIDKLPDRYETILGRWFERGHDLSTGEWQKIALARAYLRNSSILILDEPTSALDAEAEHQIFHDLNQRKENEVTILVSHRFSTIRMADKILVFNNGQIVEDGSHEELMKNNKQYTRLYQLQSQGYQSI